MQLAMQTYEMVSIKYGTSHIFFPTTSLFKFCFSQVDKHIRRLDTDLARFEADLKEKQIESTDYDSTSSKGKKGMSINSFSVFLCSTSEPKPRFKENLKNFTLLFQVTRDRRKRKWLKHGPK